MFSTLQYSLQLIKCKLDICIIQVICVTSFVHSSSISIIDKNYEKVETSYRTH